MAFVYWHVMKGIGDVRTHGINGVPRVPAMQIANTMSDGGKRVPGRVGRSLRGGGVVDGGSGGRREVMNDAAALRERDVLLGDESERARVEARLRHQRGHRGDDASATVVIGKQLVDDDGRTGVGPRIVRRNGAMAVVGSRNLPRASSVMAHSVSKRGYDPKWRRYSHGRRAGFGRWSDAV